MNGRGRSNVLRRVRRLLLLLVLAPAGPAAGDGEVRLLTDDAIPRYLSRGQELAKAEQWDKVVDVLHRVVIGDPEVFPDVKEEVLASAVYSEDGRTFYPARELCLLQLAGLPPDGLRAYRDVHDAAARQLLAAADATAEVEERLAAYAKVHDNYLPSSVGDDALERAVDLNLALGRFYEALALGRRLIDVYPKDTDRDLALALAKAAYCAARIGDMEQLTALLARLASEHAGATVKVEGKPVPAEEIKDHPLFQRGGGPAHADTDWPMAGGNAARSRTSPDLPEDLPKKPFWTFPLSDRDARLTAQGSIWRVFAHNRQPSPQPELRVSAREHVAPYPTIFPIVHEGLLLYKDGREIVARRAGSGTLVPLVGAAYSPPSMDDPTYLCPLDEIRPGTQDAVKDSRVIEAIYQYLDYGAAGLVVSSGMILATDWRGPPHELRTEAAVVANQPNSFAGYARASGKLIWAWDNDLCSEALKADPALRDAWQKDFQLHRGAGFLGPGVTAGGILYTVATEREGDEAGVVSLWAFDAVTGRVRFRTVLHYEDEVNRQLPRGAAVAMAGGTVYAVTQAGVVAAVDALPPGRLQWITRYGRGFEGPQARPGGFRGGKVKQSFAFNDPVIAEGKVIVAPADGIELLALDAETGRVAWSVPKRALLSASYVVGVKDGLLYLAGEKAFAIDVTKGEIVWSKPLTDIVVNGAKFDPSPYGRGFVGERYLHVPTHHQNSTRSHIERFDLKTGTPAEPLAFDVDRLGNLLSFDGRLVVANGAEIMCFTTYEAEVARVDAAMARPGADRALLLLERGLLALTGGTKRRDQAREDLAKAIEATPADGSGLVRRYAIDNLFAIARERNDLAAIDEAERIVAPLRGEQGGAGGQHPYDAQIALLRADVLGHLGKGQESLAALERFLDQCGHLRVVRDGRVVDGTAAGAALRDQLRSDSAAFAAAFAETVRGRIDAAVARKDAEGLKAILERYGDEAPAEEARFALADLHEAAGRAAEAEAELKDFATKHPQHPRVASAHLRLARFYARQGKVDAARRERFEAVSRLDEAGRRDNAPLVAEVDALLAASIAAAPAPRLRFPLAAAPITLEGAAPVAVEGGLPDGLALFATASDYIAVDALGKIRWSAHNPSRTGIPAGPAGEPATAAVAGAVAAARLAVRRGDDLLLGDVAGLMSIQATSGEVRWRYPANDAVARDEGQAAIDLLRRDLRDTAASGFALRAHPLPAYLVLDGVIVRVHPRMGVEAIHAGTGDLVWVDGETQGQVAVGSPAAFGDLVVVGFSKPGWIRVYQAADGAKVCTWRRDDGALLAAPLVDRLGRVYVASSREAEGGNGQIEVLDIRSGETRKRFPVTTGYAAPLHADGRTLVYHDGASGTENLRFVDLESGKQEARHGPELLRTYHVLRDDARIFVLTHNPGLEDEGGRLFRIDLKAADVLAYDYAVRATAFAPPLLTEHHVAVAALLARGAHVRLFDRDASGSSRGAGPLFVDPSGKETADMDFHAAGATRLDTGIGIAAAGDGLVVGHPWGAVRLAPPAPKEGG